MTERRSNGPYHHGDLRNALRQSAREILEGEGLAALSLRAVARRVGVSHAAPYRHFPNHEALLADLAVEGFSELREAIAGAAAAPGGQADKIAEIGAAYMRFAVRRPALARLMFGSQMPNRSGFPLLGEVAEVIGVEIGKALDDSVLGLAVWGAVHGLTMLVLEDVIDLGQRRAGSDVLPSRAEILLRSLVTLSAETRT